MAYANCRSCFAVALAFVILAIAGCSENTREAEADRSHFLAPAEPLRAHYQIDCVLDLARQVQGKERITLTNTSALPLHRLALDWALADAGGQLSSIRISEQPAQIIANLKRANGKVIQPLVLQLPQPLRPGQTLKLDVEFDLQRSVGDLAGTSITAADWYPRLWWGYPTHDDYSVSLQVPAHYLILTTGLHDPKTGRYEAKDVRSFGITIADRNGCEILQANAGNVLVRCVVTPKGKPCGRLLLDAAVDVISFDRNRFGFYPQPSLTIFPGMDEPMGGFPAATGMVGIHGMERMNEKPTSHWQWITAHEIGHQYWGEHVLEKDDPGWLWLGMGILLDRDYARARALPPSIHQDFRQRYLAALRDGHDTTMAIAPEKLKDRNQNVFDNAVLHGKSYALCSTLGVLLGQPTFDRISRRCLHEFRGRRLGAAEFQRVCEEESGQDLSWFFTAWVLGSRSPDYEIVSRETTPQGTGFLTTVKVVCRGPMPLPIPVRVVFPGGTQQTQITDRLVSESTLQFTSQTPPREIQLDPDGLLPPAQPRTASRE